jgi:peptidoglycan/xylan/chitin deacetylase (PgdA/CDA1 family)
MTRASRPALPQGPVGAFAFRQHGRVHRGGRWWRRLLVPVALALAAVLLSSSTFTDLPPPIEVEVAGAFRLMPPGITLGEVRRMLHLRPKAGHLLDVEGVPLVRRKYEGHIEVDAVEASDERVLSDGDRIEVVDGEDRTERLDVIVVDLPGGGVSNPQSHLGTTPGEQVITRGLLSGKLVSSVFRATGPTEVPPAVALTFDDGPWPGSTQRILRILTRFEVKATFFMIGNLVERYPEIVRDVADAGMAIANHTQNHPYDRPFADLPRRQMTAQVVNGHRTLENAGVHSVGFRPPGGSWDQDVVDAAQSVGERTVLWSLDTHDYRGLRAEQIVHVVVREAEPGSIILLHDGGGDRSATARALPKIIKRLRRRGLDFETL